MTKSRDTADSINRIDSSAADATAITIDANENVLAGKTSSSFSVAGIGLMANDQIFATATSDNSLALNRLSTDGDIARFYKDSTQVGSIASQSGPIAAFLGSSFATMGAGDTGLFFSPDNDHIIPVTATSSSTRDNAIDLGSSSGRFNDLYLGGGAYIGGTGSANYLDDYEEGTWTPSLVDTWASGLTTYDAHYTKIGNLVHITMWIGVSSISGTSYNAAIGGLPFPAHSGYGNLGTAMVYHNATTSITRTYINQDTSYFNLVNNSANISLTTNSQVGNSNIMANFTYRV